MMRSVTDFSYPTVRVDADWVPLSVLSEQSGNALAVLRVRPESRFSLFSSWLGFLCDRLAVDEITSPPVVISAHGAIDEGEDAMRALSYPLERQGGARLFGGWTPIAVWLEGIEMPSACVRARRSVPQDRLASWLAPIRARFHDEPRQRSMWHASNDPTASNTDHMSRETIRQMHLELAQRGRESHFERVSVRSERYEDYRAGDMDDLEHRELERLEVERRNDFLEWASDWDRYISDDGFEGGVDD